MSAEWQDRGIGRWIHASIFLAALTWHAAAPVPARAETPAFVTAWVRDALDRGAATVTVRGSVALPPILGLRVYAAAFVRLGRPARPAEAGAPVPSGGAPVQGHASHRPRHAARSAVVDAVVHWDYRLGSSPLAGRGRDRAVEDRKSAGAGPGGCRRAARRGEMPDRTQLSVELRYWFAR